ncbi:hypothetical protein DSCA_15520 [Desulfosarcina alkanivorans]|uniref:TonB-dependent receptor-like beta-barrel domain-containing protein n=1 Tax=Desulfosarcina alkanivorans TaxID=571177 RepID=A0A5K7YDQ1_9BACT|nr:TonB-dependent receptor [Desulfosarcina alkanivorans]BBO67622.1 hypothetical protein DSCA_15520 [Desulfosarcina alkanivorans]
MKIPTFGQLYQPSHGSIDQVRGNPDLDEERIWSYDAVVEYRRDASHLIQFSLFRTDTRDPIVYGRGDDLVYRPINADRSWRHGVEAISVHPEIGKLGRDQGARKILPPHMDHGMSHRHMADIPRIKF